MEMEKLDNAPNRPLIRGQETVWLGGEPPTCDMCGPHVTAHYDCKVGGPWGNLCKDCFRTYERQGVVRLGVGAGQRLYAPLEGGAQNDN